MPDAVPETCKLMLRLVTQGYLLLELVAAALKDVAVPPEPGMPNPVRR